MSERYLAFDIIKDLEYELCKYTGSTYCVVLNSCTNAIGICLEYAKDQDPEKAFRATIRIPKFTYIGVPMQIKRAEYYIEFTEEDWEGEYQIQPYNIWDSARRFRKDMFHERGSGQPVYDLMDGKVYKCLSFHRTKILGHTQGGAIIHNDKEFQKYAEMMRFDGRTPGVLAQNEKPTVLGRHCYMDPETAAALLHNLMYLPDYNVDLPKDAYADLSQMDIFR